MLIAVPLVVVAVPMLLLYIRVGLARVAYPFELEWMEGGSVDHVARVLSGKRVYVPPSVDFTPFLYAPAYYYISAIPALIFGATLPVLRAVSLAGTIGTFAFMSLIAWRDGRSKVAALACPGVFAEMYPLSGSWFEIARVDSLGLCFFFAGAWALTRAMRSREAGIAGALLGMACLTKQSFVGPVAVILACGLLCDWRRVAVALAVAGAGTLIVAALFDLTTHGWFRYYVFTLPSLHPRWPGGWNAFWQRLFWGPLGNLVAVAACAPVLLLLNRQWRQSLFHAAVLASLVVMSLLSMMHSGAFDNVAMPAHAAVALESTLSIAIVVSAAIDALGARRLVLAGCAFVLVGLSVDRLLALCWDPVPHLPTDVDREAGAAVVAAISKVDGEVYVPAHAHLASMAGKRSHAQWFAIKDVTRSSDVVHAQDALATVAQAFQQRRFAAILMDTCEPVPRLDSIVATGYVLSANLVGSSPGLWTRTGLRTRPTCLYVRR